MLSHWSSPGSKICHISTTISLNRLSTSFRWSVNYLQLVDFLLSWQLLHGDSWGRFLSFSRGRCKRLLMVVIWVKYLNAGHPIDRSCARLLLDKTAHIVPIPHCWLVNLLIYRLLLRDASGRRFRIVGSCSVWLLLVVFWPGSVQRGQSDR